MCSFKKSLTFPQPSQHSLLHSVKPTEDCLHCLPLGVLSKYLSSGQKQINKQRAKNFRSSRKASGVLLCLQAALSFHNKPDFLGSPPLGSGEVQVSPFFVFHFAVISVCIGYHNCLSWCWGLNPGLEAC
jgi:hypothetical protein